MNINNDWNIESSFYSLHKKCVEDYFPALKEFEIIDRSLNPDHQSLYSNQTIFLTETREALKSTLNTLREAKEQNKINKEWFREFLIAIGNKRLNIAISCNASVDGFGQTREKEIYTYMCGAYGGYAQVFFNDGCCGNFITLEEEKIELCYCEISSRKRRDDISHTITVINNYNKFWDRDDQGYRMKNLLYTDKAQQIFAIPSSFQSSIFHSNFCYLIFLK